MTGLKFARLYSPDDDGGVLPAVSPETAPPSRSEPAEPRSPGRVTCEGCGCQLDSRGAIIRRGDGLKAHLDREDTVRDLQKALDAARAEVTELSARVKALEPKERRSILY